MDDKLIIDNKNVKTAIELLTSKYIDDIKSDLEQDDYSVLSSIISGNGMSPLNQLSLINFINEFEDNFYDLEDIMLEKYMTRSKYKHIVNQLNEINLMKFNFFSLLRGSFFHFYFIEN